jgi:opacity protein-like surface antigen
MRWLALLLAAAAPLAHADADEWKGPYGGLGLGGAVSRSSWITDATTGVLEESVEHSARGGLLGGQVGHNLKAAGHLVVGVELAWYGGHLEQRTESTLAAAPNRERVTKILNPLYATVRLGFTAPRTLVYVRGGFAYANIELQAINHQVGNVATWEDHATGWTAGTGFEVRVRRHWSLGLGYDYSRLRAVDLATVNSGGVTVQATEFNARVHALVLRANYRY